ncbi:MAG: type II toxin-antitoxin system VapC family toxin [Nocardioidaceae bacterium]
MSGETAARGLIDTNILIRLAMVDPDELPAELVICAVTLAELSAGPHFAEEPAERARRISVLQHAEATFEPLPFDADAARAYGVVSAAVAAVGRKPRRRIADLMIASVAIVHGLPLYTANPADFAGLDDLVAVVPVRRTRG